jgi:aminopeptidase N
MTVNSYFMPGEEDGGRKALEWAMTALREFEKEFGPYPYRELDLAAMPTKAGGIEYPGLVAIGSLAYGNPNEETFFESVVVHEVAHQWWYNVVGNDQINHPWLDEALAQYSTYLYVLNTYGKEDAQGFVDRVTNLRWGGVGYKEKPIGLPVASYAGAEYSGLVYGRGPLFFLALHEQLGEAKMAEFLRRYYAENTWRIATPDRFRKLAEEVAGEDLGDLFKKWVG